MKALWNALNRPLVVMLCLCALWPWASAYEHRLSVQFTYRSILDSLNHADADLSKQAKDNGIKDAVSNVVSQFVQGFTSGLNKPDKEASEKTAQYVATVSQVHFDDLKVVAGDSSNEEKVIGLLRNDSKQAISSVHLNISMYGSDGHLIDTKDLSLSDINVIIPGQSVSFSEKHSLGDSNTDAASVKARHADRVEVQVGNLDLEPAPSTQPTTRQ